MIRPCDKCGTARSGRRFRRSTLTGTRYHCSRCDVAWRKVWANDIVAGSIVTVRNAMATERASMGYHGRTD